MEGHKNKLDVEYEQLMNNFQRELDSLRDKHLKDLDKWVSLRRAMQGLLLARCCLVAFRMKIVCVHVHSVIDVGAKRHVEHIY